MSKGIIRAVASPISLIIGKKATHYLLEAVGIVASFFPGAGTIISALAFLEANTIFKLKPKSAGVSPTQLDRLQASLDPSTPRKMAFGHTALATDVRYVEPSGTNQEYIDYIIAVASHKVSSIDEIWFEDALAWSSGGGVQATYSAFLTVSTILEGGASAYHTVNGGGRWGSAQRLTGCASIHLRIKRGGTDSPLTGGLPGRLTIVGKGLPLYDPRRDSTVAGGSGSMRANDQTTWAYAPGGTDIGQNLALQSLAYLLGWKINSKLAVGCGIPPVRLDMAGFITAANLCDETVTTVAGTQPRYHGSGLISENDDPGSVLTTFATTCNGRFRESLGKLALVVMHNDLALASSDPGLGDDEMIGGFTWNPDPSLEQTYNVVRGRFTDPSNASLYQLVDYPEVRLTSTDGIDRVLPLDLPWVQDAAMAQRLAKQVLERKQYQRTLSAVWNMAGWSYKVGDVVPITLTALSFSRRLMRVEQQAAGFDGTCPMTLTEENAAIYAWDADDRAPVTPADAIRYDPLNDPILIALKASLLVNRGVWASGTSYEFGDAVTSSGSTYRCILAHTSSSGNQPPNATYWVLVAAAGAPGGPGSAGYNNVVIRIFKRSATAPALPSVSSSYDFTTGILSGLNNGWSTSVPAADGNPLYESTAPAVSTATTYSIASSSWAGAIISNGGGNQTAEVTIYRRSSGAPALPSASTTYTFTTGILTGLDNGWTTAPPAYSAGTDLYFSDATALSTGATDTILASEWEAPQVMAKDGVSNSFPAFPAQPITGSGSATDYIGNGASSISVAMSAGDSIPGTVRIHVNNSAGTSVSISVQLLASINGGSYTNVPGGAASATVPNGSVNFSVPISGASYTASVDGIATFRISITTGGGSLTFVQPSYFKFGG